MIPRTPAEALRKMAWHLWGEAVREEEIANISREANDMTVARSYIAWSSAADDHAKELVAEAERLEGIEAQAAELTEAELATTLKEMLIAGTDRSGHIFPEYAHDYLNDRALTITRKVGV